MRPVEGPRPTWRLVALLVSATILAACRDDAPAAPAAGPAKDPRAGHEQMVLQLGAIALEAKLNNPFVGERAIAALRRQAASLGEASPLEQRIKTYRSLGFEELRLGDPSAAAEAFLKLHGLRAEAPRNPGLEQSAYLLGLAYMRLGETSNCVARHTSESCLLPIGGSGVHEDQEGSRRAIEFFSEALEEAPDDVAPRWLLNIACMTIGGYPHEVPARWLIPPGTFESDEAFPRFPDVAPRLGLNTFDLAGGAIVDDFDGDHLLDIVESNMDPSGQLRFFRNNGDGTFVERTREAGLTGIAGGLNLVHADYDNDGDQDVLVMRGAWFADKGRMPKSLVRNNGDGTFFDVTYDAGLTGADFPSQTADFADYDNDGDLDLYIGNESARLPYPSQLFRNGGDGTFTEVAAEAGVTNMLFAKGVAFGDYDADRWPDLYVSNLGADDRLYHNNGDGTFTDVAPKLGVTGPRDSFAVWFWDFNNDGALDLFVTSYWQGLGPERLRSVASSYLGLPTPAEPARLYRGDGRGGFQDVAAAAGLARRTTLPMGANFGDLDNDGWLDFYLGTGFPEYDGLIPNVMFRNRGGTSFADVTTAGGFGHLQKGHGVAFADLDHDGDQDVFEQMGGALPGDAFGDVLFENPGFENHWIAVELVGVSSNRSGIGARIRLDVVDAGRARSIYRWVDSGGSFGDGPFRQHIGIGKAERIETLAVDWPTTGRTQTFRDVAPRALVRIVEGQDEIERIELAPFRFR